MIKSSLDKITFNSKPEKTWAFLSFPQLPKPVFSNLSQIRNTSLWCASWKKCCRSSWSEKCM